MYKYTKDAPRVMTLSSLSGIAHAIAAGCIKVNGAYFCVIDGVPTKVVADE